ncbi:hypothetical protein X975_24822, partial [Stegodyphus mimosarum]
MCLRKLQIYACVFYISSRSSHTVWKALLNITFINTVKVLYRNEENFAFEKNPKYIIRYFKN